MEYEELTSLYNEIYKNYDNISSNNKYNIITSKFKFIENYDEKDMICKQLLFSYIISHIITFY